MGSIVCADGCGEFLLTIQGGKGEMSRMSRVSDVVVGLACAGAETAPRAMRKWKRRIFGRFKMRLERGTIVRAME